MAGRDLEELLKVLSSWRSISRWAESPRWRSDSIPDMTDLQRQIEAFARVFAQSVLSAIRASSLDDILVTASAPPTSGAVTVKRGRGRPRKDAAPATQDATLKPGPATTKLRNVNAIVAYVRANPDSAAQVVRDRVGLDRGPWNSAIKHCVAAGLLTRTGHKRATYYRVA